MKIVVLSQNTLEAQGLKWLIESHMTGVDVTFQEEKEDAGCLICDMGLWTPELEKQLLRSGVPWIGLSSDRTFSTAYRALKGKAQDLVFRPFDPMAIVKHLQQIRFQLRSQRAGMALKKSPSLFYEDFFNPESLTPEVTLAAFAMPGQDTYAILHRLLKEYPFKEKTEVFTFPDFILLAYFSEDEFSCNEECSRFYAVWKSQVEEPLSIFVNANRRESVKKYYQETKEMTSLIFYEGYDIAGMEQEPVRWLALDPFLTPVEQRTWIEMLGKRDIGGIQKWMENEFLAYARPYPAPEMIRIRLTSVLAQARRYMKSVQLKEEHWEQRYHAVFEVIVKGPVVYGIVQAASNFFAELVLAADQRQGSGKGSASEKTRELMEANYWNPQWNLAACAETLNMSKSTLSRKFQEETGRKFGSALSEIRLREAKRLLKETDLPLEEVARLTGFSTASYFSAVYKKHETLTPSEFRKNDYHPTT